MAEKAGSWTIPAEEPNDKKINRPKIPRTSARSASPGKTFVEAIKHKYCSQHETTGHGYVIVFHGKPKSNDDDDDAELGYLRNICVSDSSIQTFGLDGQNLNMLCPNVVDLDISGNLLDSWSEIITVLSHLQKLTFLNLARNVIRKDKDCLHSWTGPPLTVENLVLNSTGVSWNDVLALSRLLPNLKDLHVCRNNYNTLPSVSHMELENVECLRLNDNRIQSWDEIWKLRHLPNLKSLILSGNPLNDVFYHGKSSLEEDQSKGMENQSMGGDENVNQTQSITNDELEHPKDDDENINQSQSNTKDGLENHKNDDENVNQSQSKTNDELENPKNEDEIVNQLQSKTNDELENPKNEDENVNQSESSKCLADQQKKDELETNKVESEVEVANDNICEGEDGLAKQETNEISTTSEEGTSNKAENVNITKGDKGIDNEAEKQDLCGKEQNVSDPNKYPENGASGESSSTVQLTENRGEEKVERLPTVCIGDSDVSHDNKEVRKPFSCLESLCMQATHICKWKHLKALTEFPALKSVKIKDIKLGSTHSQEDRRKLFVACLPNIKSLNGSEVTDTEREKGERHLLRYYSDKKNKPGIYATLEKKHGTLTPLVDIDISKGYQENVTLTFVQNSEVKFTHVVNVKEKVSSLKRLIATEMNIQLGFRCHLRIYHYFTSPHHQYIDKLNGFEELASSNLPLSRFDLLEGDEIHFEFTTQRLPTKGICETFNVSHRLSSDQN